MIALKDMLTAAHVYVLAYLQREGQKMNRKRRHRGRVCESQTEVSTINLVTCFYLLHLCSFTHYLLLWPLL